MTRDELITQHTTRWKFRRRGPFESAQAYVDAVIAFLQTRDWAASFEVRLGKPQTEWSAADVQSFHDHLTRPRNRPNDTPVSALFLEVCTVPCTVEALLALADASFEDLAAQRRAKPLLELPIYAQVVTLEGRVLVTTASSDNRLGVLKNAAQQLPLYGYVLTFDAFVHGLTPTTGTATKRDALLCHVGTREARHVLQRPYTVTGRRVTFDAPIDINLHETRNADGTAIQFEDPYAELFVSVPTPARPQ